MINQPERLKGGSSLSNLFMLAFLAYAAFVGFQYVPQVFEARSAETLLNSLLESHENQPVTNAQAAIDRLHNMLYVSELEKMSDAFSVQQRRDAIVVSFRYERDLNLLYQVKPMHYEASVTLF